MLISCVKNCLDDESVSVHSRSPKVYHDLFRDFGRSSESSYEEIELKDQKTTFTGPFHNFGGRTYRLIQPHERSVSLTTQKQPMNCQGAEEIKYSCPPADEKSSSAEEPANVRISITDVTDEILNGLNLAGESTEEQAGKQHLIISDQPADELHKRLNQSGQLSIIVNDARTSEPEQEPTQEVAKTHKLKPRIQLPKLSLSKKINRIFSSSSHNHQQPPPHSSTIHSSLLKARLLAPAQCNPIRAPHQHHCPLSVQLQQQQRDKFMAMISYVHTEGQLYALKLKRALEKLTVSVYLDLHEIKHGSDWQDSLNLAVLNCRAFIPLITPSYGTTLWTGRELKLADVLAKQIIPVNFGQVWPPASLAIQFATKQYVSWQAIGDDLRPSSGRRTSTVKQFKVSYDVNQVPQMPEWSRDNVKSVARQIKLAIEEREREEAELFLSSVPCQSCSSQPEQLGHNHQLASIDSGYSENSSPPIFLNSAQVANYGSFTRRTDRLNSSGSSGLSSQRCCSADQDLITDDGLSDGDDDETDERRTEGTEEDASTPLNNELPPIFHQVCPQTQQQQLPQKASKRRRKSSLGSKAVKAFSKVRKSLAPLTRSAPMARPTGSDHPPSAV